MYEQTDRLRGQVLPILTSIGVGCTVGVLSVVYIARALGADRTILNSIAPKSVTVPIAVAISEPLGGVVSVTSVVVFLWGIFGSIVGPAPCCADAVSRNPPGARAGARFGRPRHRHGARHRTGRRRRRAQRTGDGADGNSSWHCWFRCSKNSVINFF